MTARPRLLIVDDEKSLREMLGLLFHKQGFEVLSAANYTEGVAAALRSSPDVILCDIGLRGMSGYDVAKALRATPGPRALLVALTGDGSDACRRCVLAAGFDAHVVKPVSPEQLEQLVAAAPSSVGRRIERSCPER